jgi:DNA-binding transcriptional LysR family regulator
VDIAIIARPARRSEIKSWAIADGRLVPVCPPDHALAGSHEDGTADLRGETLVVREAGSASRAAFEDVAEKAGLDVLASVEMGSEEAIRQVVMSGHGVGMVSERGASSDVAFGRLDLVDDATLCAPLRVHVVHHSARVLSPAQKAFLDMLMLTANDVGHEDAAD